jgi:hypothetical protein
MVPTDPITEEQTVSYKVRGIPSSIAFITLPIMLSVGLQIPAEMLVHPI